MNIRRVSKFTCSVYKHISPALIAALNQCHIPEYLIRQSKSIIVREKRTLFSNREFFHENLVETFHFFTNPQDEEKVFSIIAKSANLTQEGRGSIFVEPAIVVESSQATTDPDNPAKLEFKKLDELNQLFYHQGEEYPFTGIYCIIPRGMGNILAKTAIEYGSGVPVIFYGTGGGVRDRMGLIRITIPADKEMVNIVVADHDCQGIMNLLIEAGRLDRPGQGFIFSYPVNRAIMNTKSFIGFNKAAASNGQIISAIDDLVGNASWRRRTLLNPAAKSQRLFRKNQENLTMICNESTAKDLLEAAMDAGAPGATISECRRITQDFEQAEQKETLKVTNKPFDISDMVVPAGKKEAIVKALVENGLFSAKANGKILITQGTRAYAFMGK